jgi:type IV secretory pathway TrbF-like protein
MGCNLTLSWILVIRMGVVEIEVAESSSMRLYREKSMWSRQKRGVMPLIVSPHWVGGAQRHDSATRAVEAWDEALDWTLIKFVGDPREGSSYG